MATREFQLKLGDAAADGDVQFLEDHRSKLPSCCQVTFLPRRNTLCHLALRNGHLEFALAILHIHPPLVFRRNVLGDTPAHTALKHGRPDMIVNKPGCRRPFPFRDLLNRCLESHQYREDLKASIPRKASFVNREGKSLVYLAAEKGYVDVVSHLMTLPRDLLSLTAVANYLEGLREYFQADGVDGPNGSTALHLAVCLRKPDIIRILMEHRPDLSEQLDGKGQTALHLAVKMNNPKLAETMVDANACAAIVLNKDGISPFHLAASLGHLEIFKLFLRHYPDCYAVNSRHRWQNALHIAVRNKSASIVDYIVKDKELSEHMINQQDEDDNTPLHTAASIGDDGMLNALLASSVEVLPLPNREGLTSDGVAKARKERKDQEARDEAIRKEEFKFIKLQPVQVAMWLATWEGIRLCAIRIRPLLECDEIKFGRCNLFFNRPPLEFLFREEREKLQQEREKSQSNQMKAMEGTVRLLMVVATIVTAVTFTAGVLAHLAGRYSDDKPQKCMVNLAGKMEGFDLFWQLDAAAMCSSMIATVALIGFPLAQVHSAIRARVCVALTCLSLSFGLMLMAFLEGVWVSAKPGSRSAQAIIYLVACILVAEVVHILCWVHSQLRSFLLERNIRPKTK